MGKRSVFRKVFYIILQKFFRYYNGSFDEDIKDKEIMKKRGVCDVCYEKENVYSIGCEHYFCLECWTQYIRTKVILLGW